MGQPDKGDDEVENIVIHKFINSKQIDLCIVLKLTSLPVAASICLIFSPVTSASPSYKANAAYRREMKIT